ncbi:MAG: hypothetical protein J6V99_08795, partial [Neisseriaceae bacterium]|nr:hypothetical protein [Neisseriaceae bacterium]
MTDTENKENSGASHRWDYTDGTPNGTNAASDMWHNGKGGLHDFAENVPVVGTAVNIYDTGKAYQNGDTAGMVSNGAQVVVSAIPFVRNGVGPAIKDSFKPTSIATDKITGSAIDATANAAFGNDGTSNGTSSGAPSDSATSPLSPSKDYSKATIENYKDLLDDDLRKEANRQNDAGYDKWLTMKELLEEQAKRDESKPSEELDSSNISDEVREFIEDILNAIDNGIESVSEKLDGRNPDWGKDVLEKILKLNKVLQGAYDWIGDQWDKFMDALNRLGNFHLYDPLVLDLDGDGIELISENNYDGVLFDLNGNGIKVATQWVKGDDGLLVLDRNGNGLIDDGSELFGQDTPKTFITDTITDGFSALRQLDHNRDGKIDANDADFKNIKVWRDINSDGISQEDELFSLEE